MRTSDKTPIQAMLDELQTENEQGRKWTLAALAEVLKLTVNTLEKWKAGDREPANEKAVLETLERLKKRKRIPKQRRYVKGSRGGTKNDNKE